ncbi:endonuclease/exonuclease/phosphatase family protein [Cellulomonas palmilytica]|uniref:endonuclease/exonuclease/phosphatase family protein n=1 Tax=Cellulomonas palmilytica TaxID=2608402 RepID=UPI001F39DE7A|nr:endonuclease/exonuclease/phosphatase family protein [Cellulomonas palmilytica]UJP39074.1 endonuclease/exonuclease/phosphatase family protein [Cellulomonas palmilytica]
MRLATFNIQHGRTADDRRVDVARFARAVRELDADVLALQEVDHHQLRSGRADLTAVAAQASGAVDARLAVTLRGPVGLWREPRDAAAPRGAAYGVALVSRLPVLEWRTVRLPRRPGLTWTRRAGRLPRPHHDHPRAALVAVLSTPHGPLTVACAHLSFLAGQNVVQARHLARALADLPRPLVVLGDLNVGPASARAATGLRSLADAPTYPVHAPTAQIDHVLAEGDVAALGPARSVDTGLSDHRALVVDVRLGPERS